VVPRRLEWEAPLAAGQGRARILIIEDDFAIRRTLAEVLGEEGYEVRCAADGREALAMLADRSRRPGLIILDLWMPAMDGLEFRRLQRDLAEWADIPVLVITASRLLPRELPGLGLTDVLRKPLQLDEVLSKVKHLTGR
jgi:DNA-binding response OmpR family regulator